MDKRDKEALEFIESSLRTKNHHKKYSDKHFQAHIAIAKIIKPKIKRLKCRGFFHESANCLKCVLINVAAQVKESIDWDSIQD